MHYHNATCFGHIRPSSGDTYVRNPNALRTNRISFFSLRHWCFLLYIFFLDAAVYLFHWCVLFLIDHIKCPYAFSVIRRTENIKIDLREIIWDDMDWVDLAQDRDQLRTLVNTFMNLRVP
jgi:hypothetical protein